MLAFKLLRINQWHKNFFLFAGIIFARHYTYLDELSKVIVAFIAFCILTSGIYIINDVLDLNSDRRHPEKKNRPIAQGKINTSLALVFGIILLIVGNGVSAFLHQNLFYITLAYTILMILYSIHLKQIIILDVFIVAAGFVMRAAGGALVINVEISSWLLICTFMIALFIAIAKRRHELLLMQIPKEHRASLSEYTPFMLDQMISVVTAATVVSYSFYTLSPQTVAKFHTRNLVYTVPIVIYGIFRYLYIVYKKAEAGTPETAVIKDKPLLLSLLIWIVAIFFII